MDADNGASLWSLRIPNLSSFPLLPNLLGHRLLSLTRFLLDRRHLYVSRVTSMVLDD